MSRSRTRAAGVVAVLATLAMVPAAANAAPPGVGDYQEDDGLGFRNILPPGSDGTVSLAEAQQFLFGGGVRPPHNSDQLDEYDELLQASPTISPSGVDTFFKDASFGIAPGDVDSTYTPDCDETTPPAPSSEHCDDVTLARDESYGVPHVYGADRAAAMFGAGYVGAEDRLFFMDVERHLGRAELSEFLGGRNIATDRSNWRSAPYTEAELQAQFDNADEFRGAEGAQVQQDVLNYIDGINQYIAEAKAGTQVMPAEYILAIDDADGPDPFVPADIVSIASIVAGQFGKGGGREVQSALVLEEAQERFGETEGREVWSDLRSRLDEETETTVHDVPFPYGEPPASPSDVALPDPGTTVAEPLTAPQSRRAKPDDPPVFKNFSEQEFQSNALLVSEDETTGGNSPLAVMGPQVGYFSPQILTEIDIHAPTTPEEGLGVDARGVAFSGISMYVLLGRGTDYAWSATSANQDIEDTYAMELCDPANPGDPGEMSDDGYRFEGTCEPFEVLDKEVSWAPNAADPTPAGSETLRALRTKMGIVTHRTMIEGVPHVYTRLRATYMHEADSAVGFARYNQPATMENVAEYEEAANTIDYTFNWFFINDDEISYFNSGANPVRPADVDPNLPVMGDLDNAWENFDPDDVTFNRAPAAAHPQVTDQEYISSWNNRQAPAYSGSDDSWSYTSVHRAEALNDRIEAGIAGAETMTREELVDAMEDAATVDIRGAYVLPVALRALREATNNQSKSKQVRKARKVLKAWAQSGAHRIDRAPVDGTYDDTKAVRYMDAWWPHLVKAVMGKALGADLYTTAQTMQGLDNRPGASGSAYGGGWYGYVDKDLRQVLGEPVTDPYSREYCGDGRKRACGNDVARSLSKALKAKSNEDLYSGFPTPACTALPTTPDAQWCRDSIRATTIGIVSQPPIDWQNRPTFQQVVEPVNDIP
jgi:acyl-homoserine lactone acylase PvdQ